MVARTLSGATHETYHLAFHDHSPLVPVNTGKVCVTCLEPEAVGNDHRLAISRHIAGKGNRAACCGMNRCSIFGCHVKPCMKGTSAAYGVYPISEPVGYAVTLTYRGYRRYKPENILLTANDMPHGSDLSKISCRLQHPDRQCTLVLRRPCQSQQ